MSAAALDTQLSTDSEVDRANAAHNRAPTRQLRCIVIDAAQGGSAIARARHTARGKLLPRDRVERLLDPGSPLFDGIVVPAQTRALPGLALAARLNAPRHPRFGVFRMRGRPCCCFRCSPK